MNKQLYRREGIINQTMATIKQAKSEDKEKYQQTISLTLNSKANTTRMKFIFCVAMLVACLKLFEYETLNKDKSPNQS